MAAFDDGALAGLPLRRTRAQACRSRRKIRVFFAGLCRGIAVHQGPPGLQKDPDADFPNPGLLQPFPGPSAEMLDDPRGSDSEMHSTLGTTLDDEMDDIFRFITAIQEQRWQTHDAAATSEALAGQTLEQERCLEQHGGPQLDSTDEDLRFPGLPFLSYSDAAQLSAASTHHANLVDELLFRDADPPLRSVNPLSTSESDPFTESLGLAEEASYHYPLTTVEHKCIQKSLERLRVHEGINDEDTAKLHKFWLKHPSCCWDTR